MPSHGPHGKSLDLFLKVFPYKKGIINMLFPNRLVKIHLNSQMGFKCNIQTEIELKVDLLCEIKKQKTKLQCTIYYLKHQKLAPLRFQSRTTISFGISGQIKYQYVILSCCIFVSCFKRLTCPIFLYNGGSYPGYTALIRAVGRLINPHYGGLVP